MKIIDLGHPRPWRYGKPENSGDNWAPCAECVEPTECGSWAACEKNLPPRQQQERKS